MRQTKGLSLVLALALTIVGLLVAAGTQGVAAASTPAVSTDALAYEPPATVIVTGSGFDAGASLTVNFTGDNGTSDSVGVTADGGGSFTYSYAVSASSAHEDFVLDVVDSAGTVLASTVFHVGSHGRYLSVTWVPGAGNQVIFTHNAAFRRGYSCRAAGSSFVFVACTGPGGGAGPGDIIREDIGGTSLSFGDSSSTGVLWYRVTSIDVVNNWLFATALQPGTNNPTIPHTYADATVRTAVVSGCCRIGAVINSGSGYRIATTVQPGSGNSSPVTTVPVIAVVGQPGVQNWFVPAADSDGDPLSWRLSTSGESGGGSQPAGLTIGSATGLVSWDTTGKTLGLYWNNITIEELDGAGAVKGQTSVDYLIQIVPVVGSPPVFDIPPTPDDPGGPACAGTHTVGVGGTLNYNVQASDADAGNTVILNAVGIPVGAGHVPGLPAGPGNPVSTAFSWTPTGAQVGVHVIVYTATDNVGLQAQCSQTITVTSAPTDTTPPRCEVLGINASGQLEVEIEDSGSGIQTIDVLVASNASVNIPAFTPGTTSTITVVATKINPSKRARVELKATDAAGNVSTCDPEIISLSAKDSHNGTVIESVFGFPDADQFVTFYNGGGSSARALVANVNGVWFQIPADSTTIDIGSALNEGMDNTLILWGWGVDGTVLVSDVVPAAPSKGSVAQRLTWHR